MTTNLSNLPSVYPSHYTTHYCTQWPCPICNPSLFSIPVYITPPQTVIVMPQDGLQEEIKELKEEIKKLRKALTK